MGAKYLGAVPQRRRMLLRTLRNIVQSLDPASFEDKAMIVSVLLFRSHRPQVTFRVAGVLLCQFCYGTIAAQPHASLSQTSLLAIVCAGRKIDPCCEIFDPTNKLGVSYTDCWTLKRLGTLA